MKTYYDLLNAETDADKKVSIRIPIPPFLEDGRIFLAPVKKIKQKEYAFFMIRYLKV
jgi:hypothetical protein